MMGAMQLAARRNIELKARLRDLERARQVARQVATQHLGVLHQVDTYFHSRRGRLKLRESSDRPAELIYYQRPHQGGAKGSDYFLIPVGDPEALKIALSAACGVRGVVEKRRDLYLAENVRIHLDEVVGLGSFLEFEAVLDETIDDDTGQAQVERLTNLFQIAPSDLLAGSYSDLLGFDGSALGE